MSRLALGGILLVHSCTCTALTADHVVAVLLLAHLVSTVSATPAAETASEPRAIELAEVLDR